jgi:hypothetical protein
MKRQVFAAAMIAGAQLLASSAYATECPVDVTDPFELDEAAVVALYDCMKDKMAKGYAKEGDEVGSNYRNWTVTSTRPAVTGPHGNRFLQTWANDIAAEQYLKFAEEGVDMPVGSVLAKESFKIHKKKKKAVVGPLFIMTKLEKGASPDTDDWLYSGLQPNGKPMKFKQSFCSDCHVSWEDQDDLAYPAEEVRITQ